MAASPPSTNNLNPLNPPKLNLLWLPQISIAYKTIVGRLRDAWRVLAATNVRSSAIQSSIDEKRVKVPSHHAAHNNESHTHTHSHTAHAYMVYCVMCWQVEEEIIEHCEAVVALVTEHCLKYDKQPQGQVRLFATTRVSLCLLSLWT